jgi:integrase
MPNGFCRTASGYRAWVRVSSKADAFDMLRTKRFAAGTSSKTIRDWRTTTRSTLEQLLEQHRQKRALATGGVSDGFRHDVIQSYLPAVSALTTYKDRVRDMNLWIDEFGDRDRHSITPLEIRAVRNRWLTTGPKRKWQRLNGVGQWIDVAEPLAASTVNHRLRALSNFFTVLDPRLPNPAHDVPEADEPHAIPRSIEYTTIRQIIDAMPDRRYSRKLTPEQARAIRAHAERSAANYSEIARDYGVSETMVRKIASARWKDKADTYSLAKVRARVMAWAGVEPTELGRIPEQDIIDAIETGALFVPGRRKGRGSEGRVIPLNEDAVDALKNLVRLKACGPFRSRGVLRAWGLASKTVLGRSLRLKDLRHSFVTTIVATTKDLKIAQLLAGHTHDKTTRRYALAALLPMLRAGVDSAFPPHDDKKETKP